jgi:hypothetical protein
MLYDYIETTPISAGEPVTGVTNIDTRIIYKLPASEGQTGATTFQYTCAEDATLYYAWGEMFRFEENFSVLQDVTGGYVTYPISFLLLISFLF